MLSGAAPPPNLPAPVSPACISSPFGPRDNVGPRAATFHRGVDFPALPGAVVRAVASGRIARVGRLPGEGLSVDIQHDGFLSRYAHLGTIAPALAGGGRSVRAGDVVGRVGRTGVAYGSHLHLEIHVNGVAADPAPLLGVSRCERPSAPRATD